jgi:poly-gamma-glutamate system protein
MGLLIMVKTKTLKREENHQLKVEAALIMKKSMEVIRDYRLQNGITIDLRDDPNQTGLIGKEYTDITTSLGNLPAKRTATNPDFAALLVDMFLKVGLKAGDTIAVGSSGSFPSLVIATMAASKVMGLRPIIISAVGASMWGANDPRFSLLDMERILYQRGILPHRSVAASMGGDWDRGVNFLGHEEGTFLTIIKRSGVPLIYEEDIVKTIEKRVELYHRHANGEKIKLFVNVGGASANIGECIHASRIPNGLSLGLKTCSHADRGVIFRMAERGIPIIHLLNIRGLAARYGLPIDPIPLPEIGKGSLYYKVSYSKTAAATVLSMIFAALLFIRFFRKVES